MTSKVTEIVVFEISELREKVKARICVCPQKEAAQSCSKLFLHVMNFICSTCRESERLDSYECIDPELHLKFDLVFNHVSLWGKRRRVLTVGL